MLNSEMIELLEKERGCAATPHCRKDCPMCEYFHGDKVYEYIETLDHVIKMLKDQDESSRSTTKVSESSDPELTEFFVKYSDEWHLIKGESVLNVLIRLAKNGEYYTELFENAFKGCDKKYYIDMHNRFASYFYTIQGMYVLGEHLYGDYQ